MRARPVSRALLQPLPLTETFLTICARRSISALAYLLCAQASFLCSPYHMRSQWFFGAVTLHQPNPWLIALFVSWNGKVQHQCIYWESGEETVMTVNDAQDPRDCSTAKTREGRRSHLSRGEPAVEFQMVHTCNNKASGSQSPLLVEYAGKTRGLSTLMPIFTDIDCMLICSTTWVSKPSSCLHLKGEFIRGHFLVHVETDP